MTETAEDPSAPWQAAHDDACREGRDGYLDPQSGMFVFTADALRRRGTCCGSGCRHCPYPPEARRR